MYIRSIEKGERFNKNEKSTSKKGEHLELQEFPKAEKEAKHVIC